MDSKDRFDENTRTIADNNDDQDHNKEELKQGWTWTVVLLGLMITISTSYQFGYNIGVLNQPVTLVKEYLNRSYSEVSPQGNGSEINYVSEYMLTSIWSLVTTLYVLGGMIGAFFIGFLADRFGRKKSVMLMAIPACLGGLLSYLCVISHSPLMLLFGRFVTGINCGAATQLGPMYLLEIVPFNLKGAMGTCHQLFITIGIFTGSVFGLREILGSESLWPVLLLLNIVPGILSLIVFPFLPESPRYLVQKDKVAAESALKWLRRKSDVSNDMKEMEDESMSEESERFTIMKLLRSSELRPPLVVAVVLQLAQQLSGINAIFFYSTGIYERAGVQPDLIQYANVGTCAVNVLMTIIVVPLMDRAGRRILLLYPMAVMIAVLAVITVALKLQSTFYWMNFVSIACIIGYVISFALGLGPIPCMITAELFRQGPRARAMSLSGLANWISNAIVAMGFELVQALAKEFVFLIFLVIMVLCLVFVYFKVPETKNKTFDEIANQFKTGHSASNKPLLNNADATPGTV